MVPQAGTLDTVLGYPISDGDTVYRFLNGIWSPYTYYSVRGWYGCYEEGTIPAPSLQIGEAIYSHKAAAANWTRTFSITN